MVIALSVDTRRVLVARVAGDIVGKHEDDVGVGDPEALDGAVQPECISHVLQMGIGLKRNTRE